MIDNFDGQYKFLSNFHLSQIYYEGNAYPTVEHAYQASKTFNLEQREYISKIPWNKAGQAKRFGRKVNMRSDWEKVKVSIMQLLLWKKFDHAHLRKKLNETGNKILIEGNYWHDNFWGNCKCQKCNDIPGQNTLGILLMALREELP